MEETYVGEKSRNWPFFLGILVVLILIVVGVFLWLAGSKKLVSPVPPKPSFEVIFYTPTPGPVTPSATPSATPKGKKAPTNTPKPSPKATIAPTVKPTVKASASPTAEPTP